ncbi:DUF434 domain-containing protein [Tissierella carlieri]
MSVKIVKRGFDPNDHKWFSEQSLIKLSIAQEEIEWLLDRNYKLSSILEFVGGHYQLSARQRIALKRATSTELQYKKRKSTMLPLEIAKNGCMHIDGFNLIITLEVALSGSPLIFGNDGVIRDLAGLRGTYKPIDKTDIALQLIGNKLNQLEVPEVIFFLDAPVSNSGILKSKITNLEDTWKIPLKVELVSNPDSILSKMERVVTSDSIILDECKSWFNLSRKIIEENINNPWIISFKNMH